MSPIPRAAALAACALAVTLGVGAVAAAQTAVKRAPAEAREACVLKHPGGAAQADALKLQAACAAAGNTGCDAGRLISQAAAQCIAQAAGLPKGTAAWDMLLLYNATLKRPTWSITNTEGTGKVTIGTGELADSTYGTMLVLDAVSGQVLSSEPYSIAY